MKMYNDAETLKEYIIKDSDIHELDELSLKYGTDKSPSGHWYTRHYHKYLNDIKNNKMNILEIGVHNGCSLRTWKNYFINSEIYGLDILEKCKQHEEERIHIKIGDCTEESCAENLFNDCDSFDVIIDDGSHHPEQIIKSFDIYFDKLKPGGLYFIEDLFYSSKKQIWKDFFIKLHDSVCLPNFNTLKQGQWLVGNRERAMNYINEFKEAYGFENLYKDIDSFELYMNFCTIRKASY